MGIQAESVEHDTRDVGTASSRTGERPESEVIRYVTGESSLGVVLVARSDRGICAILIAGDREALLRDLCGRFPAATLEADDVRLDVLARRVIDFIESPGLQLDLALDLRGTEFQLTVWEALREIPPGSTVTYTEIAARIGRPASVRAVAGACAANPVAVLVPCHRVVRSDGGISGYRWGVERKRSLLETEAKRGLVQAVDFGPARSASR